MGLKSLSSRAVLGEFARTLEMPADHGFVTPLSHYVPDSNMFTEEHRFVGAVPGFLEWTGSNRAQELADYLITVKNKPFEAVLSVYKDELQYDKTGQVQNRVDAWGQVSMEHWEELISPLIVNGGTGIAYDGQYFFDTDHSEGDSGTMSNLITVDISDMTFDADYKGTPTAPGAMAIANAVLKMIKQMYKFKNDKGKPINQMAKSFLLYVPVDFMDQAAQALTQTMLAQGEQNPLLAQSFKVSLSVDPRCTWTDSMALFRTDGLGGAKPFIRQQMGPFEYSYQAEGSYLEHTERRHEYKAHTKRGVQYGLWQHAVKATFQA